MPDILKWLLDLLPGYKTYLAGVGLIGLGLYQLSQGDIPSAIQSMTAGLGLLFVRRAVERGK